MAPWLNEDRPVPAKRTQPAQWQSFLALRQLLGTLSAARMASRNYYQLVVRHPGLHKQRVIRGDDRYIVEAAAQAQTRAWNELYAKKLASEERRRDHDARRQELEDSLAEAEERTHEAEGELNAVRGVLAATLRVDDRIDWERLKQHEPFSQPQPPHRPYLSIPPEPQEGDARFKPQLGLLDKL